MSLDDFKKRQASVASLSDDEIRAAVKKVAQRGEADYPADTFKAAFGSQTYNLAATIPDGRFSAFLRKEGYELFLKPFPEGNGCEIRRVRP